ncbi:MAG: DNA primase [Alphaproteobacteria bacterium]|jgi:DNA primase
MSTGRFSPEVLEQIRQRVSLADVISKHAVGMKKKGRDWWACCPFHNEATPSFHIHESKGYYHCFGCGAHGNVFDFVKEVRGGSFVDAVTYLGELSGVDVQLEAVDPKEQKKRVDGHSTLEKAAQFFEKNLVKSNIDYFKNRGLSNEIIKTFRLGFAMDGWSTLTDHLTQQGMSTSLLEDTGLASKSAKSKGHYDRFRNRVMFPIESTDGKVVGFGGRVLSKDDDPKYLNSAETKFFNKRYMLYNLNRARDSIRREKQALVVEGYMDVIGLWAHGVKTAVAPMGTAITEDQMRLLWRFHEAPIICLDGDNAGRGAAVRIAKRILSVLEPGRTLQFAWMPDGEDPDSFISANGKEAFEALIKKTVTLEAVLWQDLSEGRDVSSGDGRAAIESDIDSLMKQVNDDTIKRHYTKALKDRLWTGGRKKPQIISGHKNNKQKNILIQDKQAHILLSILFRKPDLFEKVYEKVSGVIVENQELEAFRKTLFKLFLSGGLEKDSLDTTLANTGILSDVENLLDSELVARTEIEKLEALWFEVYEDLERSNTLKTQKHENVLAASVFDEKTGADAWARMKSTHGKRKKEVIKPV